MQRMPEPPTLGEYNGFEIYPMPVMIILSSEDPERLAEWYRRALGFGVMLAGPVFHVRRRKYQDVLIASPALGAAPTGRGGPVIKLDADGELDAIAARAKEAGAAFEGPVDTPWNTTELRFVDPQGHRITFSSRRAVPDPEIEAKVRAAFEAARIK
jgi:uncharacterized glyoxalase superfamily protein PhnB